MKHRGTKILALLLSFVLALSLLPGMSLTAWADDPYASLKNTTTKITFDGKDWYLIDYDTTTVTLLSKECVGVSRYDTADPVNVANTWYTNNITATAKTAVNGSGMFLLTIEQVKEILGSEEREASSDVLKCSVPTGADYATWWLCSPGLKDSSGVAIVLGSSGKLRSDGAPKNNMFGVRPALKLDLSKVTFDSTSNTFTVGAASYTVTLTGGTNATASGGAKTQNVTPGQAMTTVTYTANSGSKFPEISNLYTTTNGITVTRTSDTVVTVSGTPTANVNITVPDAAAIPTYTVSFAANGGSGSMASVTVNAGSTYNLPACDFTAPTGKRFKAWSYDGKEYAVDTQFTINSDATFIAVWQDSAAPAVDKYTVTYEANNGSGETKTYGPYEAGTTHNVQGQLFAAPEGKVFDCWQGSDGKTYKVGAPVVLNANLTLTAQWKDEEEQQGGSGESGHGGITGDIVFIGGFNGGAEESWEYVGGQQRAWKVSLAPMVNGSAALGIMTGESTTTDMNVYPTSCPPWMLWCT